MPTAASRTRWTRRRFTQALAGGAVGVVAAPALLHARNLNEKLNVAVIGAGGRGGSDTRAVASDPQVEIVALCDVYRPSLEKAAKPFPQARLEADFRKLFDAPEAFDAVIVATCEHTHALATMMALKHGKHVYCEKPLTHDVWESRQIRLAADEAKVATQMGIQIHGTENYRQVVELIQTGAIGPVREVHVWVNRAWGLQSKEDAERNGDRFYFTDRPSRGMPVPEGLDWDLWIGPAPYRPFHEDYFPGPKWYRWWDFGNGTMSDLGSHWVDLPFWALKLDYPRTVEAFGPPPHPEIAPATMRATYEYGPRGDLPPVTLTWYQGAMKPEIWTAGGIPQQESGHLFVGDEGMILSSYKGHTLLPEEKFADYQRPEPFIPRVETHHAEWVAACKNGGTCSANFDYSGWLTEANHLGNVAYRVGKKLQWDPVNLRATNAPEADRFLRCPYREGWELM